MKIILLRISYEVHYICAFYHYKRKRSSRMLFLPQFPLLFPNIKSCIAISPNFMIIGPQSHIPHSWSLVYFRIEHFSHFRKMMQYIHHLLHNFSRSKTVLLYGTFIPLKGSRVGWRLQVASVSSDQILPSYEFVANFWKILFWFAGLFACNLNDCALQVLICPVTNVTKKKQYNTLSLIRNYT